MKKRVGQLDETVACKKAQETSLKEIIAYYNEAVKPINWTYTVEKLEQKIGKLLW